jgi:hypothetical protein
MNRIAHPPRQPHAKPFGFGACARVQRPWSIGHRGIDTTG